MEILSSLTSEIEHYKVQAMNQIGERHLSEALSSRTAKSRLAGQLEQALHEAGISKSEFARRLRTSRTQVERLLDPENDAVTVEKLRNAANALGKDIQLELVDSRRW